MSNQALLLAAILVIAIIALGGVAYNSSKLSDIAKKLEQANNNIKNLGENQNKTIPGLESKIKQLTGIIEELNSSLNQLREKQGKQYEEAAKQLEKLSSELASLKQQLNTTGGNLTILQEKIRSIEKSIDQLSSLLLFPVTVTDATGKPVTIPEKPTRIVSLFPSATEILWAVNASSQVIAVDSFSNYPPSVVQLVENGTLINIGSGFFPDVEKILSVNPDLVIGVESVSSNLQLKELLSKYGIPMLILPDANFQDVIDSIIIVGKATGHPAEASEIAANMKSDAIAMRNYINNWLNETGVERESIAIIIWISPLWVTGNGTFQNDLILLAGGRNALSMVTGWTAISAETLLAANPDVIVITAGPGMNTTRQSFINTLKQEIGDSVYNISAVKNNRIYFISGEYTDMLNRPGPRTITASYLLSIILYPEAYGLTPENIPVVISPDTFQIPSPPWK